MPFDLLGSLARGSELREYMDRRLSRNKLRDLAKTSDFSTSAGRGAFANQVLQTAGSEEALPYFQLFNSMDEAQRTQARTHAEEVARTALSIKQLPAEQQPSAWEFARSQYPEGAFKEDYSPFAVDNLVNQGLDFNKQFEVWQKQQDQAVKPLTNIAQLRADLKAGRIGPEEFKAALRKETYIAPVQGRAPTELETLQSWYSSNDPVKKRIAEQKLFGSGQIGIVPDPNSPTGMSYGLKTPGQPAVPPAMATVIERQKLVQQGVKQQQKTSAPVVVEDIGRALKLADNWTTGFVGGYTKAIPGTRAHDLQQLIAGIGSNITIDKLQQMRANSPTGGALGQVSNYEDQMLRSAYGSLEQSQSKGQFVANLERLRGIYMDIVHGPGNWSEADFGGASNPYVDKSDQEILDELRKQGLIQ